MKNKIRNIVILVPPNPTILSIAGPLEIFSRATNMLNENNLGFEFHYELHIISTGENREIKTSSGLPVITEGNYLTIDYPIDTLIIAGMVSSSDFTVSTDVLQWIKEQSLSAKRIASICTGAFLLAKTGILNGKKVTTHWQHCKTLAELYPEIKVEIAPYFVKDGNVYTSAGISSGMDLSLALIEEDLGRDFALLIAKWMVLFMKRPGNQLQYANLIEYHQISNKKIRKVCEWLQNHIREDNRIENLAEIAAMSSRNFARVFVRELKITPAKYIDYLRIENACQYLTETQLSLDEIAELCGLRNAESLRRLFLKILDTTPAQYRRNFC